MAQIDDFFMYENRVEGITDADYQRAQPYVEAAQAFAQTTYQSIYIIDYFRKDFLYVSDNPLFLCGHTADEVRQMGYGFYLSHVPEDEVPMLTELNRSGFRAFYDEPVENRRQCMMSYDFHITHGDRLLLVNHKITPLAMTPERQRVGEASAEGMGRVWLALCTVSLSPHKEAGHIEFFQFHTGEKREYSLEAHRWKNRETITLKPEEKQILTLSAQGYTMKEIAGLMLRSFDTVKFYRRQIFEKLGVQNITEALALATNYGLV